ncbi:MAG: ANTAR domain-containing protein [Hungatella sp.]
MTNVIVAFSKPEDARNIKNILMRNGFSVVAVCTSGSQAISCMEGLSGGVMVSGYRFEDMLFHGIRECLPKGFEMLLVASPNRFSGDMPDDILCLPTPLKVHELLGTLELLIQTQTRNKKKQRLQPKVRNEEELQFINHAKELLMERNHMTETEAYRYLQKCSMDSGNNMTETARMVLSLIHI